MIQRVPIGKFCVFADDAARPGLDIVQNGLNYETHVRRELERLVPLSKGFLDIGANVGVHSISAKDINPDLFVASVEMLPKNLKLLCRAYRENKLTNYAVIPVAVASEPRIIAYNNDPDNTCCWMEQTNDYNNLAAALPIRFYNLPPIDLIKIDIEGFEFEAWQGMEHLFARKAKMIFEFCPKLVDRSGITPVGQLEWLMAFGYKLTVMDYLPGIRRTFTKAQDVLDYIAITSGWITDILAEPI